MSISKINKNLTLEYLSGPETIYYDRKKAKISDESLANEIASFANANGGVVAVGINDSGELEGFNSVGIDKFNNLQKVVTNFLKPSPIYECEIVDIINKKGDEDNILLFHIEPSMNYIVRNSKDEVYCRQGDSSIKLKHEQIRLLEYDRKERNFETEIIMDSSLKDLDVEVLEIYKEKLDTDLDNIQVLKARGYIKKIKNEYKFTNAGMLLFGINPSLYLPSARLRVLKYEGNDFKVGTQMNIVKDKTFDKNLYRVINESKDFISSQLRDFTYLGSNGLFETHPEYPEFCWYEGIVNAVTHRDYSNSGEHTTVKIFSDRMEILSPGKLGGFVTVDTIREKRYSRNPQIARTLSEFGIVRELNEGVKRIFDEMKEYELEEPVYTEPDRNSVLLVLNNNAENREEYNTVVTNEKISKIWNQLSYLEQQTLEFIANNKSATRSEIEKIIGRSKTATITLLNGLVRKDIIIWTGLSKNDKLGKYIIK